MRRDIGGLGGREEGVECVNWGSKYHEEPHQFYMMIYTMPINHFLPFYVGERGYWVGGGG